MSDTATTSTPEDTTGPHAAAMMTNGTPAAAATGAGSAPPPPSTGRKGKRPSASQSPRLSPLSFVERCGPHHWVPILVKSIHVNRVPVDTTYAGQKCSFAIEFTDGGESVVSFPFVGHSDATPQSAQQPDTPTQEPTQPTMPAEPKEEAAPPDAANKDDIEGKSVPPAAAAPAPIGRAVSSPPPSDGGVSINRGFLAAMTAMNVVASQQPNGRELAIGPSSESPLHAAGFPQRGQASSQPSSPNVFKEGASRRHQSGGNWRMAYTPLALTLPEPDSPPLMPLDGAQPDDSPSPAPLEQDQDVDRRQPAGRAKQHTAGSPRRPEVSGPAAASPSAGRPDEGPPPSSPKMLQVPDSSPPPPTTSRRAWRDPSRSGKEGKRKSKGSTGSSLDSDDDWDDGLSEDHYQGGEDDRSLRRRSSSRSALRAGMFAFNLTQWNHDPPRPVYTFQAVMTVIEQGCGIRPKKEYVVHLHSIRQTVVVTGVLTDSQCVRTGETAHINFLFLCRPEYVCPSMPVLLCDGPKTAAIGVVTSTQTDE
mmetsp:Transcript_35026/g.100773  ORF Transcript_35026/g.100773 Transcript_35026/m.100773 type:complete len:533 (+) Transcript_35026:70-1668(+)